MHRYNSKNYLGIGLGDLVLGIRDFRFFSSQLRRIYDAAFSIDYLKRLALNSMSTVIMNFWYLTLCDLIHPDIQQWNSLLIIAQEDEWFCLWCKSFVLFFGDIRIHLATLHLESLIEDPKGLKHRQLNFKLRGHFLSAALKMSR